MIPLSAALKWQPVAYHDCGSDRQSTSDPPLAESCHGDRFSDPCNAFMDLLFGAPQSHREPGRTSSSSTTRACSSPDLPKEVA